MGDLQKLEAGVDHRFNVQITLNNQGIVGQAVKATIQRLSDNKWWSGTIWDVSSVDLICSTSGAVYSGDYYYDLAGSEIVDGVEYVVQFKILSGIYTCNRVERFYAEYVIEKLTLEYDFSTYTNAVILWYDTDRPLDAAVPIYWAYIYNALGERPTNTSQIALKDRIMRWSEVQPSV